jgi:hypothetical protein
VFDLLHLVTLAPTLDEGDARACEADLRAAAAALPDTIGSMFEPTLPGVHNGGDYIWRTRFPDEAAYRRAQRSGAWCDVIEPLLADRARIASIERVAFAPSASGGASPGRGLYRVALFCANQEPTRAKLDAFAVETASMAQYVRTIRSWQLSTTTDAEGTRPWTHVWEQEYDDLDGLKGAYMMHPCHWAYVDRWFDPEYPEWLVDRQLCHTYCNVSAPVLV